MLDYELIYKLKTCGLVCGKIPFAAYFGFII